MVCTIFAVARKSVDSYQLSLCVPYQFGRAHSLADQCRNYHGSASSFTTSPLFRGETHCCPLGYSIRTKDLPIKSRKIALVRFFSNRHPTCILFRFSASSVLTRIVTRRDLHADARVTDRDISVKTNPFQESLARTMR
jgi:hypothetical protein